MRNSEAVEFWRHHKQVWDSSNAREMASTPSGLDVIELITIGRISGKWRSVLVSSVRSNNGWIVVASNLGRETDPNWWMNLKAAACRGRIRVGGGRAFDIEAAELDGRDRALAWSRFTRASERYKEYEATTTRRIPVIALRGIMPWD